MARKNRLAALLLAVIVAASTMTFLVTPPPVRGQESWSDDKAAALAPLTQAIQFLLDHYHRPLDVTSLIRGALVGMLKSLDDPYTVYFEPDEYDSLQTEIEGSYGGVGLVIEQQDGVTVIQSVMPGTPADGSGLLPGDHIVQVDGQDVSNERPDLIARKIRGRAGTPVTITVRRGTGGADEQITVRLVRARIDRDAIEVELFDGQIGYVRIIQFFEGTSDQVAVAYDYFERIGVKGIILDLRNNPGGLLNEAIEVSRLFVPGGPVVHIVAAGGKTTTYDAPEREPGPPLAVLVDGGSASASEIVAGAIQDNKAGVIVGSRTFGKGSVQSITRLQDGGALKFTTAEYLTPLRRSITGRGIEPDVPVGIGTAEPVEWLPLTGRHQLRRGDRGLEVEGLQQRLNRLGYDTGGVDGIFGPKTEAALRQFQSEHKLPASGSLDRTTYETLIAAVTAASAGQSLSGTDVALDRALNLLLSGQVAPAAGPAATAAPESSATGGRP